MTLFRDMFNVRHCLEKGKTAKQIKVITINLTSKFNFRKKSSADCLFEK